MDILLVCSGNTCRSAMAEGLLKEILIGYELDRNYYVCSAGISTTDGLPATQNAITAAGEFGSDISLHKSKQITKAAIDSADLILCMTQSHKNSVQSFAPESEDKTYTLAEYVASSPDESDYEIDDPYGGDIEEYQACAEDLNELLETLAEKLEAEEEND